MPVPERGAIRRKITPTAVLLCDVASVRADAGTVDALARLQLAVRRHGCQARLRGTSPELRELFKLGWQELRNSYSKRHFLEEASHLVGGLTLDRLIPESRVGIRSLRISRTITAHGSWRVPEGFGR